MAVLAALFMAAGCDNGTTTAYLDRRIPVGAAADFNGLQRLLGQEGINSITYYGTLAVGANTLFIPAGKTLTVEGGGVTVGASGLFAVAGTLNLGESYGIASSGTVAGSNGVLDKVTGGTRGSLAPSVAAAAALLANAGNSMAMVLTANGADLTAANIPAGKTLYVSDLTLAAAPNLGGAGGVSVLGKVSVGGTMDLSGVIGAAGNGKLTISDKVTIASTAPATVTLPAEMLTVKAVDAGTAVLSIGGVTGITAGEVRGSLELAAGVTAVNITGGTGNVTFTGTPAFTADSLFGNTGLTTFNGDAGSNNAALSFAGPVVLNRDFTRTTGGAYRFGGGLTLADGKTITLGGTGNVTLARGKAVKTGTFSILEAGGSADLVLTPAAGATLTATMNTYYYLGTLTLGAANLTVTNGVLTVKDLLDLYGDVDLVVGTDAVLKLDSQPGWVIASGDETGTIIAEGGTDGGTITVAGEDGTVYEGFTTEAGGVTVGSQNLAYALLYLKGAYTVFTDYIALDEAFGQKGEPVIGTASPEGTGATEIVHHYEDIFGKEPAFSLSIDPSSQLTMTGNLTISGTDSAAVNGDNITISVVDGGVKITDAGYNGNTDTYTYVILTFSGGQVKNRGLISPMGSFSIGLKTKRGS